MQYKCEFRIRLWNFETTHEIDLPCYWLYSFLEESMTQMPESESARKKSRWTHSRWSLVQIERTNHWNYTDQAGSPVVCRTLYTGQYGWYLSQGWQVEWFTLAETANGHFGRTERFLRLLRLPTFFVSSSVCVLTGLCFYEGFVIQQKTVLDTDAVKSVYVEYSFVCTRRNNNDNSNNKYDLPLILQ